MKMKTLKLFRLNTFQEVISQTEHGQVDIGLIAIENTVAGSILNNYQTA